jgi:DNA polymerase zeta
VLYGDTDSLFVVLKGRSIEEAFRIGAEIASYVTASYPHPIELKFEKVYSSLFLVAKKRYAGMRIERLGEKEQFECKGLEVVRRDGCDAVVKTMSKLMTLAFTSRDLS